MNKKVLVIAVFSMVVAMLALPMSGAFAAESDKFVGFTFYGGPDYAKPIIHELRDAGESDNHFVNWISISWKFSWTPTGTEVWALGGYSGYWVQHGYDLDPPPYGSFTAANYNGVFNMTVTDWDGEEGCLMIGMVMIENPSGKSGSKLTVMDGMIGDMKVHGIGTGANVVPGVVWQYNLQLHFDP